MGLVHQKSRKEGVVMTEIFSEQWLNQVLDLMKRLEKIEY